MPIRVPVTISTARARGASSNGGSSSGRPSCSPRHAERLAEPARPGAEERGSSTPRRSRISSSPSRRLERAHEHGARDAFVPTNDVQAPVDAVRAVDVGVRRRRGTSRRCGPCAGCRSRAQRDPRGRRPRPRRSPRRRRRRSSSRPDQLRRDLMGATRQIERRHSGGTSGARARLRRTRAIQATPPETIENRSDVSDASTPASRSPRLGALATCMNSIPSSRPRR